MKNKVLVLLFIGIFALAITGCDKKEKALKKIEVKGPRVVCTYTDDSDDIKTENKVTLKFNSDNYVNYQLLESKMTFKDKKTFNYYADAMKESVDSMETDENVEYDYSINKSKKQISTYLIYNEGLFDYSRATEEEKADYLASVVVKKYEAEYGTCKFIEISKTDLGIE